MVNREDRATVLSPGTKIAGRTQARLGDEWWRAIYAIPADRHFGLFDDATDPRGRRGSVEKAMDTRFGNSVQFIGGAFGPITNQATGDGVIRIERSIVLPEKGPMTVFLPILNASQDNLVIDLDDENNLTGNKTAEELRGLLADLLNPADEGGLLADLFASLDGRVITALLDYRQISETPFAYKTPFPIKDSLLGSVGYSDETFLDTAEDEPITLAELARRGTGFKDSVTIEPAVSDGYWLAINLIGGGHTLRFGGALGEAENPFFSLDISYETFHPLLGNNGTDRLIGGSGKDYLEAANGNDHLQAGRGDDLLLGGGGQDLIDPGRGRDEAWGDGGRDTFVFRKDYGDDTIFDFSSGDIITIPTTPASPELTPVTLASGAAAVVVDFGSADRLTLVGVQQADLQIDNGVISLI